MSGFVRRVMVAALATTAVGFAVPSAWSATPAAAAGEAYVPLAAPQRVLDTRPGAPTADGQQTGIGIRQDLQTTVLPIAGRVGLAADVSSVVLNVTVTEAQMNGYVTVFPCDAPRPTASNVNFTVGQTIPNTVISKVAANGTICLFTFGSTHLIVDVAGAFAPDAFAPLAAPRRLLDTRPASPTADNRFSGIGLRAAGATLTLPIAGRAGVPDDATTVVLNVTVTDPQLAGFITVYPCNAPRPTASNLNYSPGQTIPNAVVTALDDNGDACLFTFTPTHLIVDVAGSLAPSAYAPLAAPQRILDTRPGSPTADNRYAGNGLQPQDATIQLDIAGRVGIPTNATAVILNVTTTEPVTNGFITAHPRGSARPTTSNLNFSAGQTIANTVITALGPAGQACIYNQTPTHLVIDVAGYLTAPTPPGSGPHCPGVAPINTTADVLNQLIVRPNLYPAVGEDRIAVWICDVPADSGPYGPASSDQVVTQDENAVAAWAQANVRPYFIDASAGRYVPTFIAVGRVALTNTESYSDCARRAAAASPPTFTNVFVTDTRSYGGGVASPGLISFSRDRTVLDGQHPSATRRYAWVGGGSTSPDALLNPSIVAHEIGHTLHWPHSHTGTSSDYNNILDVMSGRPENEWCQQPAPGGGTLSWPCKPQHTLAINRLTSGWIDGPQVAIHRSGMANYVLDAPGRGGVQMVALPDAAEPRTMMTIEARPKVGWDSHLGKEGVALHISDQIQRNGSGLDGISTNRHHHPAVPAENTYAHVVGVGETLTVQGVRVTVLGRSGDRFVVTVTGAFHSPDASFFS